MRSTIQTLTNISYDGRTIDLTEERELTCTVNCDCLSHIAIDVHDMDAVRSPVYTSFGNGYEPIVGRGETMTIGMNGRTLGNGYDQLCIMTIYQARQNMTENETSPGRYDVYMGSGRIQADSETTTDINIGKGITYIRPARYDVDTPTRLIGGCVIQLKNTMMMIESYDPDTGIATVLSSVKINGTSYSARRATQGEKFKLLTNYLTCDAFAFYGRSAPSVTLSYSVDADGLQVSGTYSQANGTGIQSYKLTVEYYANLETNGSSYYLMKFEDERKYSQTIEGTFPVLGRLADSTDLKIGSTGYGLRISCEVTTQDNYTKTYMLGVRASAYNSAHPFEIDAINWEETNYKISFDPEYFSAEGMRTVGIYSFEKTTEGIDEDRFGSPHYYGSAEVNNCETEFDHITEGHGRYYKYYVFGSDDEGKLYRGEISRGPVYVFGSDSAVWSIRKLVRTGEHEYSTDSALYEFAYDVQPGNIENCINGMIYNAESAKPKYVHGNDNYDKGTLTAILINRKNTEITINKDVTARYIDIADWNDLVSSGGPFLLKTDKGDVKIVQITSNPVRSYGAGIADIGIVKVTIGWTEVDDINKAVFG